MTVHQAEKANAPSIPPSPKDLPLAIHVFREKQVSDPSVLAETNGYVVKSNVIQIAEDGNVILHFRSDYGVASYRVDSALLIARSTYFRNLLDPSRGFAEAQRLSQQSTGDVPAIEVDFPSDPALPDPKSEWPSNVVRLAHFLQLQGKRSALGHMESQKVDDLFFLSVCWDRFVVDKPLSIGGALGDKPKRRKFFQSGSFDWPVWSDQQELDCRKLVFACYRLGLRKHLAVLTSKLIVMGSRVHNQWLDDVEGDTQFESVVWHLPAQIEGSQTIEEIFIRRRTILGKLAARIDHYITQYTSSTLQCRFGYGTSNACDLFQLGQMLRFFDRKQIAELRSTRSLLGKATTAPMYEGSIMSLLKSLRAIPDAQIDEHHQHCGVRKDMLPLLDTFEAVINREKCIGICGVCWNTAGDLHKWTTPGDLTKPPGLCSDLSFHVKGRATFEEGLDGAIRDYTAE